jgi:hypothetical protein
LFDFTEPVLLVLQDVVGGHPVLDHPDDKASLPGFDPGVFILVELDEIVDDRLTHTVMSDALLLGLIETFPNDNSKLFTSVRISDFLPLYRDRGKPYILALRGSS